MEEIRNMEQKDFMKLVSARERRKLKRGLNEGEKKFLKKLKEVRDKNALVRTKERDMLVLPEMPRLRPVRHHHRPRDRADRQREDSGKTTLIQHLLGTVDPKPWHGSRSSPRNDRKALLEDRRAACRDQISEHLIGHRVLVAAPTTIPMKTTSFGWKPGNCESGWQGSLPVRGRTNRLSSRSPRGLTFRSLRPGPRPLRDPCSTTTMRARSRSAP
jgi:hypothetical protein